jgi:hypothetical protein
MWIEAFKVKQLAQNHAMLVKWQSWNSNPNFGAWVLYWALYYSSNMSVSGMMLFAMLYLGVYTHFEGSSPRP